MVRSSATKTRHGCVLRAPGTSLFRTHRTEYCLDAKLSIWESHRPGGTRRMSRRPKLPRWRHHPLKGKWFSQHTFSCDPQALFSRQVQQ